MHRRFVSAARPVFGFHPPNPQSNIARHLVKKFAVAIAAIVCAASTALAQAGTTITGTVTNEQGVPLPGATVLIQGTTIGAHTDDAGRYTIVVPASRANGQTETLVARVIGYAARTIPVVVTAGGTINQNFSLVVNPLNLDVVVVTGAGTSTTRARLTTTINTVDSSAINRAANPQNIVSALAAQAPNVEVRTQSGEPGASASVKIRGASSLSGTNQPLFVVDGQPIDNQTISTQSIADGSGTVSGADASTVAPNRASDINPADIESIQILKSAAAAAIYGARAANGVVLITTKSGTPGATRYTLSSTETFDRVNMPDILQHTFVQGIDQVAATCGGPDCSVARYSWGPAATAGTPLFNHASELFDTGITADNNLQVSGGNDRTTFYASGGLLGQNGYLKGPNNKYNRATVRLKGTQQVNSKLKIGGNLSYIDTRGKFVQKGSNLSGVMLGALRTPPNFNNEDTYLANGLQRAYRFPNATSVAAMENAVYYDNPFFVLDNPGNQSELGRSVSNLNVAYTPFDWLNVSETLGADYYNDWRLESLPLTSGNDPVGNVTRNDINNLEIDHNLIATAKHTFGSNTDLTFTVGQNLNSRRLRQTYAFGEQLIGATPFNLQNTVSPSTQEYRALRHIEAYFGQVEASVFDQLVVNLGLRNDGFSTFGKAHPRANYPKASAAWTFSNLLNNHTGTGALSYGKLHIAYGETGKEPPAYASVTAPTFTNVFGLGGFGDVLKDVVNGQGAISTSLTLGNPDLRPERNKETEIGLDMAFLNSKVDMSATTYNKRGSDIILAAPINAASTGSTQQILNAANISNKGVELTLNLHPIQRANTAWDVGVQYGRNRGKVLSLNGAQFITYNREGFQGAIGASAVGFAPGVIQGTDFARCGLGITNLVVPGMGTVADLDAICAQSTPGYKKGALFLGPDGLPVDDPTARIIADPNPKYTMSYTTNFRWNKLSLSGLLDVRKGGSVWNGTRGVLDFFGTGKDTYARTMTNGQYGVNYATNVYPTTAGPGVKVIPFQTQSDWENWFLGDGGGFGPVGAQFVEDGSFAKLREISLTYTLDNAFVKNATGFSSLDIRIAGRNLKTWTKYSGFDPEVNLGGAEFLTQGLDYFINPPTRSFVLSFSLSR
ncbi:MAG TPA: SusC/RagA family TonB-linked outer membrane protein [Gemmatimonadaceae bacterium]|nr:SusC/RagA family TonB-linked outer membrane protein [Gemmatimonadaceae bacterium]